ncbi:autotransporter outer membrane beta-barrel domain-containing protein [Pseudomonas costantinii]|uniref:autotransporter outer membrane beta-barrel domain-containing protein n=1 Tax=Pseudomonas costantinii TaxID=168469 RepID=UPI0015A0BBA9|nr:autotransporter outer membrane beta-barrel domain-containing protein [Pseudomonas costantinii]NVZ68098.1 autotransporter outer membrane beta-barrel domain-containing protein [Pseudomonas costantinii]
MPFTPQKLALVITFIVGVTATQLVQAQFGKPHQFELDFPANDPWFQIPVVEAASIDGYLTRQATTHNGLQVANVLEPALTSLLQSGALTSEEIKALERFGDQLAQAPGGIGAALEQLAGSQNANLAAATQNTTQQLSQQLLSALRELPADDDGHFWVKGLGNDATLDSQHGSAGLKSATQGLLLGADWTLDHAWRVGVLGAKSSSNLDAQRFSADLDSWHLGGYAVRQDGPLALRLGAIYSSHAGQTKRNLGILNYTEQLKGRYDAQSQTAFAEAGYQLGLGDFSLEPFAGIGYQRYHRESFKEQGGLTALSVGAQAQQNFSSTFGLRLAKQYRFDNRMSLTPHFSTGWKHLYGNVGSQVRQSYRVLDAVGLNGDFTIDGTSLDRNSLNLQAGLDLALSQQHTIGLTYSGETGTHSSNHGLMGQWRMSF